jgi:hypothetical protein
MSDELEFHRFANVFPLLEGQQFRDLVEDVRVHGLRAPIVLHEGAILDGRNRYRACRAAQVAARFEAYAGKDPLAFVVSANLQRRHLDASQRAMIAAEIVTLRQGLENKRGRAPVEGRRGSGGRLLRPLKLGRPGKLKRPHEAVPPVGAGVSADHAAKMLNVSSTQIRWARQVRDKGIPDLVKAVRTGSVSVQPASEVAALPKQQQQRIMDSGGPDAVSVVGRQTRRERLDARRIARAAAEASEVAVFDHVKIGDGRSIGNVRIGELMRLADDLAVVADTLRAIFRHTANPNHADRVRDIVSAAVLSEMLERAWRARDQVA